MLAISRFRSADPAFRIHAEPVLTWWRERPGCESLELLRNLDDPQLWALVGRWRSVGDYRRSFNGYDAKLILTPLLLQAIDEPSAYLPPEELEAGPL